MNRTMALAGLGVVLVLGACSNDADEPEAAVTGTSAPRESVAAVVPDETASSAPTGEASPHPAPTETAEAPAANEIPDAIRGRWGLVPKDCTSTLGDAKGLLTVSARQLMFYESVAKLEKVREAGDDRIQGTFGFSGEGQTWTLDVALDVQDGGKTLIRRDTGKDALPGPLKYTRCT